MTTEAPLESSVSRLDYRLHSANPYDTFERAAPWRGALGAWACTLVDSRLSAEPREPLRDTSSARADLEPRLRAWEVEAFLSGQYRIHFIYTGALVDTGHGEVSVEAADEQPEPAVEQDLLYRRSNETYPQPDPDFSVDAVTARLVEEIERFRRREISLPSAARTFVSELVESAGTDREQRLNIDSKVIETLSELSQRPAATGREEDEPRLYRGPEWQWMQEALMRIALQVGRSGAEAQARRLALTDFRTAL